MENSNRRKLARPDIFTFIHAADIHLDSPLKGLEQYDGAPVQEIRRAPRNGLVNLVDLAIQQRVNFVLIAGDLYDGDWKDFNTPLFFVLQASRLREAGIPLFLIAGNHDARNRMTRSMQLPDNVVFFSSSAPQSVQLSQLDVAIHGQSFATAAVPEDLSAGYPAAVKGCFNIGMLHSSADGRAGHDTYAPCSVEGLQLKGYDYWALGHIHQREILSLDPFISFSGNIQGRHIRETGPKGCWLVTVADDQTVAAQFQALDVMRWEIAAVNISSVNDGDQLLELVHQELQRLHIQSNGLPLAVRVELHGQTRLHRELEAYRDHYINQVRGVAIDAGRGELWIEKIKFLTIDSSFQQAFRPADESAMGELTELFAQLRREPNRLLEIGVDLDSLLKKLPPELRPGIDAGNDQHAWLTAVLNQAESWLLNRMQNPTAVVPIPSPKRSVSPRGSKKSSP